MPVKKVGGFPGGGARWESLVLFVLAAVGIGWRLRNYLHAKSVWLDEVSLATEIMRLSLYELLTAPLERAQVAPPGYLLFSKLVTWCTAMNEFSLRLVPYVGSTVGVCIGWWFARRAKQLSLPARSVFLGLVAVSPVLGLYAAEAKQYGLDAVVTLGLLALVLPRSATYRALETARHRWTRGALVLAPSGIHPRRHRDRGTRGGRESVYR